MTKPNTALTQAARNEAPNVSLYEASARGSVALRQNSSSGRLPARMISAAIGINTMNVRNSPAKPSVKPNPGSTLGLTQPLAVAMAYAPLAVAAARALMGDA